MRQDVPHEVNPAPLPGGIENLGNSRFKTFMGIGDDKLDATQSSAFQLAQEFRPDRFGF
jgi:hypothetical protein